MNPEISDESIIKYYEELQKLNKGVRYNLHNYGHCSSLECFTPCEGRIGYNLDITKINFEILLFNEYGEQALVSEILMLGEKVFRFVVSRTQLRLVIPDFIHYSKEKNIQGLFLPKGCRTKSVR